MKTNIYKKIPKKILEYLIVFCMMLCTCTVNAQCTPSGATCICPMIYMPVCGCDGVMYSNSCLANCQGVAHTPAVSNGSGGFLPCPAPAGCTVGVTATATNATSAIANDGTATATLVGPSSTCATTFLWSNGATTAAITNLSPGNYTVYTTDCQGCVDSATVTVGIVSSACVITASGTSVDESCAGACDGSVSVNVSGSACITTDTVIPGPHVSNYTSSQTRGYYFQAQSSYVISGVHCSDDNTAGAVLGTNQSVEIVDLGTSPPVPFPGPAGPHTVLFSAINVAAGWLNCNVNIVAGNYYGVIGAKHAPVSTGPITPIPTMYNSYGQPNPLVTIDGLPTTLTRFLLQGSLASGSPASPIYMAEVTGPIGRIDILTGISAPGALSYIWSTGDTTKTVNNLCPGTYSVTVTDCQGCVGTSSATVGTTIVYGCTDSTASNFNPCAVIDDGSCLMACPTGIGANSESFEDPAVPLYGQGPWANWVYDAASSTFTLTNGWRKDNLGTGSTGTGPLNGVPSLDGAYYLYCETSGQYSRVANLVSSCVDLNNFTQPAFVFGYHMLGATIGTFNVDVSNDGGATWITEFTKTGDQGSAWLEGIIDLSLNYSGQIIQVRMNYTSGTSFTGDCAIDFLRFMESPIGGCMDPWAANYNPLATIDDGSCLL